MKKNTFYIDSYLQDRIRTCLYWSAFMYDNKCESPHAPYSDT